MLIGVGLPTMVPGTSAARTIDWAVAAEQTGFGSLSVLDRLAHDNPEPLITLAAVAAATERIRLSSTVLLAPARLDVAVLAKQLASLWWLAPNRLTVGMAVGARRADYVEAPFERRGARLDRMLVELRELWDSGEFGPAVPAGGPPVIIGGHSPAAMRRAARHAAGWISGGGSAQPIAARVTAFREIWQAEGRTGEPRVLALVYYALGPSGAELARDYLGTVYAGTGPYAQRVIDAAVTARERVPEILAEHREAGCDEVLFFPCANDPAQLDLLAAALPANLGAAR